MVSSFRLQELVDIRFIN